MRHLSDFQIQELLTAENRLRRSFYNDHLELCFQCREKLKQYQKLFANIEKSDDINISLNFTDKVLARVTKLETVKSSKAILSYLLPLTGSIITLVLLNYLGFINILGITVKVIKFSSGFVTIITSSLLTWLPALEGSLQILVVGVAVIGLFHLLDYALRKPNVRQY